MVALLLDAPVPGRCRAYHQSLRLRGWFDLVQLRKNVDPAINWEPLQLLAKPVRDTTEAQSNAIPVDPVC